MVDKESCKEADNNLPTTNTTSESVNVAPSHFYVIDYVDFVDKLLAFFPVDKVDWAAGTYDQYLFDLQKTVMDNYEKGNYQVSYFYAHLIFMSYVYYSVERTYQFKPDRTKDVFYPINAYRGREDKPNIETYQSIYEFSKIPEKEIFKVFYIMGMDEMEIKALSSYISNRDDYAHATGEGNISEEALEQNIKSIIGNMQSLHKIFQKELKNIFINFLLSNAENSYDNVVGNIEILIADNTLSTSDLLYLCNVGIRSVRNENEEFNQKYKLIKNVKRAFIEYCKDNYGFYDSKNNDSLFSEQYLYWRYNYTSN